MADPLFHTYTFGKPERTQLDRDGHYMFAGLLTEDTQQNVKNALEGRSGTLSP